MMRRIRDGPRGGSRAGAVDDDADGSSDAVDEDALFSESAMEGSLRGGANAFVDSMDDGGLETIKFEAAPRARRRRTRGARRTGEDRRRRERRGRVGERGRRKRRESDARGEGVDGDESGGGGVKITEEEWIDAVSHRRGRRDAIEARGDAGALTFGAIDRRGIAWIAVGIDLERSMEIDGGKPRRGRLACLRLCARRPLCPTPRRLARWLREACRETPPWLTSPR